MARIQLRDRQCLVVGRNYHISIPANTTIAFVSGVFLQFSSVSNIQTSIVPTATTSGNYFGTTWAQGFMTNGLLYNVNNASSSFECDVQLSTIGMVGPSAAVLAGYDTLASFFYLDSEEKLSPYLTKIADGYRDAMGTSDTVNVQLFPELMKHFANPLSYVGNSGNADMPVFQTLSSPTTSDAYITPTLDREGFWAAGRVLKISKPTQMSFPTSASSTASGTSAFTVTPGSSTQYINIPVGYNSTAKYIGIGPGGGSGAATAIGSYTFENKSTTYGFEYNASIGAFESNNKNKDSTYALCRLTFNITTAGQVVIEYVSSGENNYDYGIFGNIDQTLSLSTADDGTTGSTKVKLNCKGAASTVKKQIVYDFTTGTHYIDIKYRKDGSSSSGNDSVRFWVGGPALSDTNLKAENIKQGTTILGIVGTNSGGGGGGGLISENYYLEIGDEVEVNYTSTLVAHFASDEAWGKYYIYMGASQELCELETAYVDGTISCQKLLSGQYEFTILR